MTTRKRNWLLASAAIVLVIFSAIYIAGKRLSARLEPYIRDQAVAYLSARFDSEVALESLRLGMPEMSPLKLYLTGGKGMLVEVSGENIVMRHKGRRDLPPMFSMREFRFQVDLGTLFDSPRRVQLVTLDGLDINIPPKGDRPEFESGNESSPDTGVIIERVIVTGARLNILPREKSKPPLEFNIHRLQLDSAGRGLPMRYDAALTNAKPPGEIVSRGRLGPWVSDEPGNTPLSGDYSFENADLGVFKSIAGTLESTGQFTGTLSELSVRGEAVVPDFRLQISGNPVPLTTRFEVLVDGTNGDTILQPVVARLGATDFTTSGAVIKNEQRRKRSISLDVSMPDGNLHDVLRLAMKGRPFMEGKIALTTRIEIPPLEGDVKEKLLLDGKFEVKRARFLEAVQDKIDTLSRRGLGEPGNEEIDNVVSGMKGTFNLENEVMTFKSLSFNVPGAAVDLAGTYRFGSAIDLRGTLRLNATVSQTMTGWKRWLLKPVDPFFAKNGAGTFLRIKVDGTAEAPRFGRDDGEPARAEAAPAALRR